MDTLGGRAGGFNVDITSETFRRRFFEQNKPWILAQLAGEETPRTQLLKLTAGDPTGLGADGFGVSDDDGSESDWGKRADTVQLSSISKAILDRWARRVRQRLGLPDRQTQGLDISSDDDDSEEDGAVARGAQTVEQKTKAIAILWLRRIRHVERSLQGPSGVQFSSDDSSSDGGVQQQINVTGKTREIARLWLAMGSRRTGSRQPGRVVSGSDSSSDDGGGWGGGGNRGPVRMTRKTQQIAQKWLAGVRRGGGDGGAGVSSDSSSESGDDRRVSDQIRLPP